MVPWKDFASENPALAAEGERLLYRFGLGLGFLATVRKDSGPRVHPVCPILAGGHSATFSRGDFARLLVVTGKGATDD
jgi:hypothetical protein